MNNGLVLITHSYPYGQRWDFVEDEIPYLAKAFSNITVLSLAKDTYMREDLSIPTNVQVIRVRQQRLEILSAIKTIPLMFLPEVVSEVSFAFRKLGYHNIKSILKDIFTYKYFYILLKKEIKGTRYSDRDTLYYSYWMNMDAYALAVLKKKGYLHKIVTRTHGVDCFIERSYNPYRRLILEQMDRIYPVSETGKKSIEKYLCPYVKNKSIIEVKRLGVERKDKTRNPDLRNKAFTIVSCSNVIGLKRIELLVDALKRINDKEVEWIHFGKGALLEKIKAKSQALPGNIHAELKGFTPKSSIFDFYGSYHIDLFVNCSEYEGVPVSIMEALSFGIPVLATNAGGTGEIIGQTCGKLLPIDITPKDLENGIRSFMDKSIDEMNVERNKSIETFHNMCDANRNYTSYANDLTRI